MKNIDDLQKKIQQNNETITANVTDPITKKIIKYNIVNKATLWRVQTLFSKEPITIEWIRKFQKNKVFFDVGANVGMYSIFAAINSLVKVYSFEPESNNFQVLMQNIVVNNLTNKVTPYPIGLSNKTEFTNLHLGIFNAGQSHHTVGENALNHQNLEEISSEFNQGIFSTTLDDLCFKWKLPIPAYLKIDVDGIENKIIEKAKIIISKSNVESILIEINENREQDNIIINTLKKSGFNYDKQQVNQARRQSGPHKGYAEYLFFK